MIRMACTASALLLTASIILAQKPPAAAPKPPAPAPAGRTGQPTIENPKPADDKTSPTATKPNKTEDPGVEVQFTDGSLVKLVILDSKLDVTTRYGRLSVPLSEIRKIEMGLRYPDGAMQKIQSAIAQLGDADYKKREAASNDLLAYRELAYPLVRRALKQGNAEAQKRAKTVLEELRKRLPEDKLLLKDLDTITTADFPIAGHIEAASFKAMSPLLGNVDVKLFQVRGIRWLGHTTEVRVTIDAAKYGAPNQEWLDTGIDLSGDRLTIEASGTVDVMPNNPGQFMASPDGVSPQQLGFGRQNGTLVGQPGALIGKIGAGGKPFLIGAKHDSVPHEEGRLYLRIEPSPWRMTESGSFAAKITTGK